MGRQFLVEPASERPLQPVRAEGHQDRGPPDRQAASSPADAARANLQGSRSGSRHPRPARCRLPARASASGAPGDCAQLSVQGRRDGSLRTAASKAAAASAASGRAELSSSTSAPRHLRRRARTLPETGSRLVSTVSLIRAASAAGRSATSSGAAMRMSGEVFISSAATARRPALARGSVTASLAPPPPERRKLPGSPRRCASRSGKAAAIRGARIARRHALCPDAEPRAILPGRLADTVDRVAVGAKRRQKNQKDRRASPAAS